MNRKKHWYDYLWIVTPVYLALGFFNILFAWLGMIFFCLPLLIAIFGGNKPTPRWMCSKIFRYGFLIFFLIMFLQMLWTTCLVGAGAGNLNEFVKLFWTFQVPWHWAYHGTILPDAVVQYAFGFYRIMLTSTLIGLVVMIFFKPRSWCVFCPMGSMTQLICRLRAGGSAPEGGEENA